jgi:hypothetical protein
MKPTLSPGQGDFLDLNGAAATLPFRVRAEIVLIDRESKTDIL